MKKRVEWFLKESARDFLALGSIAFLILVLSRAILGPYLNIFYQLIISSLTLLIFSFFIKNYEYHLALGFILVIFTLLFYDFLPYDIFSIVVYIIMIMSALYLKIEKIKIIKGIFLGIICTIIGYYLTNPIINILGLPL